jgi:thioredoxin-related protein
MKLIKPLLAVAILSMPLLASSAEDKLVSFLQDRFGQNPNIKNLSVKILESKDVPNSQPTWKGNDVRPDYPRQWLLWKAVKVNITGHFQQNGRTVPINEKQVFFTDGNNFTSDLISLNGEEWKKLFEPKVNVKHYKKENLISGSENSKHKIVIFSDPLCPYCQRSVPPMLEYVSKYPKTFAVYYYHLPLERIHPAAVTITRLMRVAQNSGNFGVVSSGYKTDVNGKESDQEKIVAQFNKATGLKLTLQDSLKKEIVDAVNEDVHIANDLEVRGTPTIFLDGDKSKRRDFYLHIKTVD